jgi:hypothetical protein
LQGYQRNTGGIGLEDEELQSDAAVNHGPKNRSFLSDFNDELLSLAFSEDSNITGIIYSRTRNFAQ